MEGEEKQTNKNSTSFGLNTKKKILFNSFVYRFAFSTHYGRFGIDVTTGICKKDAQLSYSPNMR